MACKKYTITNTGSTTNLYFEYRRCGDGYQMDQVPLNYTQTKNIWFLDGTFEMDQNSALLCSIVDDGVFPVSPSNTPTQTPTPTGGLTPTPTNTPTNTPTVTPTPSITASETQTPTPSITASETQTQTPTPSITASETQTQTPTPTVTNTSTPTPTHSRILFVVTSGITSQDSCNSVINETIYGDNAAFDINGQFYNSLLGPVTIDLTGYYTNSGKVAQLDSDGFVVGSIVLCSNVPTPTPTVTQTATPTPTFGYYTYSLGTGSTANLACTDYSSAPNTIYGTVAGGPGPNISEYLYTTPGNPPTDPVSDGFYSNGTAVFEVSGGLGQIIAVDPTGC